MEYCPHLRADYTFRRVRFLAENGPSKSTNFAYLNVRFRDKQTFAGRYRRTVKSRRPNVR